MKVSAKMGDGPATEVEIDLPETLKELEERFGAEVCATKLRAQLVVEVQSGMRTQIKAGKTAAEIQTWADSWVPGTRKPAKTKKEKAQDALANLTPEERKALLKDLAKAA